jgi:hypothetical protein
MKQAPIPHFLSAISTARLLSFSLFFVIQLSPQETKLYQTATLKANTTSPHYTTHSPITHTAACGIHALGTVMVEKTYTLLANDIC